MLLLVHRPACEDCTWIVSCRLGGMAPDEASTVVSRVPLKLPTEFTGAPTAAARPPSRTAVRIDWTLRNARPNSMIPNRSMKMSGARSANSTADAPPSPRSRLPTEVLPVQGLERFVERHRVPGRASLDGLVGHPELAQLEAVLDEPVEAQKIDGGSVFRYPVDLSASVALFVLPEQGHRGPLPGFASAAPVSYAPGALRRIRRRA